MPKPAIIGLSLVALVVMITFLALRLKPTHKVTLSPTPQTEPGTSSTPAPSFPPCPNFTQKRLQINTKEITVAVADSPAERMHGLSGCPEVPANSGMYFVLGKAHQTAFWMKDMLAPLDIVWIKEGKVVNINANILPPAIGQSEAQLPQYQSPGVVDAVLELPAGQAHAHAIKIGTTIKPQ